MTTVMIMIMAFLETVRICVPSTHSLDRLPCHIRTAERLSPFILYLSALYDFIVRREICVLFSFFSPEEQKKMSRLWRGKSCSRTLTFSDIIFQEFEEIKVTLSDAVGKGKYCSIES